MSTLRKVYAIFRLIKAFVEALSDWKLDPEEVKEINKLMADARK
ncbi:hypothetical protein [Eel River basin pequenovirus]|nr:hypothetical protein [Eel River basin pequenovirus]